MLPFSKILERLMLPYLKEHLTIPDFQHGFRAQHSTVSALHDFTESIAKGFNKKKQNFPSEVFENIVQKKIFFNSGHQISWAERFTPFKR